MATPQVGQTVKVVERAKNSDTKVVTQGIVTLVDEANNRLEFDVTKTKLTDTANVSVRIEVQAAPLPNTPGSVIRIGTVTLILRNDGAWIDQGGSRWSPSEIAGASEVPEVVFEAPAA